MSEHYLVVTLDDLSPDDAAEYATLDQDERAEWDDDRRQCDVECSGVDTTCHGWRECFEPHADLDRDEGEGTAHGVYHQWMHFGWATKTGQCCLLAFPDAWCDSGYELAGQLGVGRHRIDFDWQDEYAILLDATPTQPTTAQPARDEKETT